MNKVMKAWHEYVEEFNNNRVVYGSEVYGLERTESVVSVVRQLQGRSVLEYMIDGLEIRNERVWNSWDNEYLMNEYASDIVHDFNYMLDSVHKFELKKDLEGYVLLLNGEVHSILKENVMNEVKEIVEEMSYMTDGKVVLL